MPLSTELPVGDLFEFIGDFRLNGDGPPTTGRVGLARLQELMLSSTSLVGARVIAIEGRLATAESFTNQISSIASRLTAVEALGGISNGTDLVADGIAVRTTRYWARPGEALRTWTAQYNLAAKDAAPMTAVGAASITTDGPGGGPALRITGLGYASPIARTHLDDGEVVEFTYRQARRIDNTGANADANNVPVNEVCCYRADGSFIGTAPLPATRLLAADGLRTITYRVSLNAALSQASLPAGTRFVSPLVGERGSAPAAMEFTSVDRNSQSLANAPAMTDPIAPEDSLYFFDDSTKLFKKLPLLTLAQYVEAYLAPLPLNWFKAAKIAPSSEANLIAAPLDGGKVANVRFQNKSKSAFVAISFGGVTASLTDGGSYLFGPGQGRDFDVIPQGRIGIVSDVSGSPIACEFTCTTNTDPNLDYLADQHLARYQGGLLNDTRRLAIRNLYKGLITNGWIDLTADGGAIWVGRAPGSLDAQLDWSNTAKRFDRALISGSAVPDSSMSGTVFNGNNAFDTAVTPRTSAINKHSMFVYSDTTLQGTSRVAGGNASFGIGPNRSAGSTTIYSGGAFVATTGSNLMGGLQGFKRDTSEGIRFYRNKDIKADYSAAYGDSVLGSTTPYIGAMQTPSGLVRGYQGTLELYIQTMDRTPTDAQVDALSDLFAAFRTALGA